MKKLALFISLLCCVAQALEAQLPEASFYRLERDKDMQSSGFFCLAQDDFGFIWFGSYHGGGLYRYDGYEVRTFVSDPSNLDSTLTSNRINEVYAPGDGKLYIATHGGWAKLDITTGAFSPFADDHEINPEEGAFYTTRLLKDTESRLWITSSYGLATAQLPDDSIHWLKPKTPVEDLPVPERIRDIQLDITNANILWLGSYHGLFSYNISLDKYTHFRDGPKEIDRITQDRDGMIWIIPTASNFIVRFDPNARSWTSFGMGDSFPKKEEIYGVEVLENNQMWIASDQHVGIFDPNSGDFDAWQFDPAKSDGLLPQGRYYALLNDRNGRLWIGSWYGIQYTTQPVVLPQVAKESIGVKIIDIKSNNDRVNVRRPLIYKGELNFLKDQRDFEIKYVLPNPLDPLEVEYRYQLEGYEKDWVTTKSRVVRYSRVPGGSYNFQVQGRDGDGDFSMISSVSITVEKKLTEHWWFWLISVGLLVEIVAVGIWLRISAVRKDEKLKAKFKQDLAEIQMQALRAQMNPHFLFNCLNSIKYYALSKDKDETADYLSKFSLLVRTILNNSKTDTIDLKDELEAIRLYVEIENLRLENKFNYEIEVDSSVLQSQVQIPPMVLQPYIENAIWHGLMYREGRGQLLIQVKDLGSRIQCVIEDNGIGRGKSKELAEKQPTIKRSLGMQITSDRLKLIREMHGVDIGLAVIDLYDNNGCSIGTRVVVEIPHLVISD